MSEQSRNYNTSTDLETTDETADGTQANDTPSDIKTFALPSLHRDENSYVDWVATGPSHLRICFARQHFATAVADEWTQGTVVSLASADHEPVELYLNERLIARGVLVTKRGRIGMKVTELVDAQHSRNAA